MLLKKNNTYNAVSLKLKLKYTHTHTHIYIYNKIHKSIDKNKEETYHYDEVT